MSELRKWVQAAARAIRAVDKTRPKIGIVLGTGLGGLADKIKVSSRIPYEDIPHFPTSTVDTHAGDLILGTLAKKNVVALSGRFHFYEGYSLQDVPLPIRLAKTPGMRTLI
ncbi:MAG: purine-nucleoside phosphorylase, partial [Candidatus Hydrogenedentes bacterium]|nr:purine-nucleoside phosphorylase [Candidatus Hydrogenedentota bacterium]